ncbi:MAG TPA: DUF6600 domain-containing protein [Candidatus Eisenbacteria bacterium]|nr:DUF6600 domain-containing protein [Candidatus Eisenbacteria bacterium]
MRHRSISIVLLAPVLAALLAGCGGTRRAQDPGTEPPSVSPTIPRADLTPFRDALEPYGEWIESRDLGTVWVPHATPAGWRPYTTGRWLSTNHGWMWLGEEPWAWAAYHYGRWVRDDDLGWVWRAGNTWAPAWVAWRHGQGYVGWAPLAPGTDWMREASRASADGLSRDVDPFAWSFVRVRDFSSTSLTSKIPPVGRNPTLLSLTRASGRYVDSGARVAERGFSESGAVERPVRLRVVDATAHRQNRAAIVHGSTIEVYRPEALKGEAAPGRSSLSQRPSGGRGPDLAARERREQDRLDERMAQERERLRREQERELRQRPESISEDNLLRRQKKEVEAQEEFEKRERAMFTHRRERIRTSADGGSP